jgi:hypothetical protein
LFNWNFLDDPHTSVFISKGVQERGEPVVFVAHNRDDGSWEFLGKSMIQEGELPLGSCFHHPIDNDPTLAELHDLPLGWFATREKPGMKWRRCEEKLEDRPK